MPALLLELKPHIHFFIGAGASAATALALVHQKPHQKPFALLTLAASMGAVCLIMPASAALWLLIGIAYTVIVCLMFCSDISYSIIATLLTFLFMGLYHLGCRMLPSEYLVWAIDLLAIAVSGLCCYFGVILLPQASALPVADDLEHRKKFYASLLYVGISLVMMNMWLAFALLVLDQLTNGLKLPLVLLTAAISALMLGYIRRLAFSVVERFEALVDKQYQNDLLSFMQVIRSQRHDFTFHMRTISGLIGQKQYEECDQYVQQMVKNASAMNDILPLCHPANSAIIHAFSELARQNGIELDIDISSDLAQIPCTIYETNTIIGNLLQNAIDELKQSHSCGPIQLLIMFRAGYYIIRVSNPCLKSAEELRNMFQPGFSTKQSHEGLGLAAVRRIAGRYDGTVFSEFSQGEIRIIVQIPFCA